MVHKAQQALQIKEEEGDQDYNQDKKKKKRENWGIMIAGQRRRLKLLLEEKYLTFPDELWI